MPRRDFSKVAFAATGDTNAIPTPSQPDGSVSLQNGWGFDYQRDNGAGGGTPDPLAKNIDREDMNGILNEVTASIGEIQQNGQPIWVLTAAPYPLNALVRHSSKNWKSTASNNSTEPGTTGSNWDETNLSAGQLIAVKVITSTSLYTRPADLAFAVIEVCGGGAGSGVVNLTTSTQIASTGGAGAGGYAKCLLTAAEIGASQNCTIGTGGSGGVAPSTAPTNGGSTSFGSLIACAGGNRSAAAIATSSANTSLSPPGGGGVVTSTAGVVLSRCDGESGTPGFYSPSTGLLGGNGGSTPIGSGGNGAGAGIAAVSGKGYGGGGGASSNNPSGTAQNGAPGAPGVIIVWEYRK